MKDIRSKFVKESLLDYETLANSLKENTSNAVRDLLNEAVRDTYNQILTEEDDDEYEVEEVDDTTPDTSNEADEKPDEDETEEDDSSTENEDEKSDDTDDSDAESESGDEEADTDVDVLDNTNDTDDSTTTDVEISTEPDDSEWAEFEKYKVGDDEYDFSNANDDEIVKVYKLLKDDDQVLVNVDNNKVELKDNETGAEYLLDLSSLKDGEVEFDFDDSETGELNDENNMNESRLFEIVLNEYDSHVGYTDNYQKKDAMTTPSNDEPGKNVNSWDAGVPKGKAKPWVGKANSKPFEKQLTEEDDEVVDEATNVGGFVQQNSTSKSHIPNSNGRKARNSSVAGVKTKSTSEPRYDKVTTENKIMKKVNKILKENDELKLALSKFKKVLQEAAVTNVNLGQIIKLISENSTTKDEKQEIIARFGNEAKTVEQSKNLYESISRELKKNKKMSIEEDKQFTANGSQKINETQIYQSKDLLDSLDLMHRLCK